MSKDKNQPNSLLGEIVALAKRRGFIYSGSEIYGGLAGFYDFGPLGVELKFNIKQAWWQNMVQKRDDVVGISSAIIMNPKVWEASGHISGFVDVLIECSRCHKRFKADELEQRKKSFVCPECGEIFESKPRRFNLMFKTFVGSAEETSSLAFLRPETAAGIFVNFKNVLNTSRLKIPFGIAQIGKAFRNEINPKDYIFRIREFEQMELEYFVEPKEANKYFQEWVENRFKWYQNLGFKNIRKREQTKEERAHYSQATTDIEYRFPFGWQEIEGIANRGDFDLKAHQEFSGEDLSYFDEESKKKFLPYVIEPSAGVERILFALLCEAYHKEKMTNGEERIVLKLNPKLAPYKVAVFPLLANKPKLVELARTIYQDLKSLNSKSYIPDSFNVAWDDRGNIGKRYYAQDEIGTPLAITVDFQTIEDKTVTLRDRDTMRQIRIPVKELQEIIKKIIEGEEFLKFGELVK